MSTYQINNVLRVYGEQLRQSMMPDQPEVSDTDTLENIHISAKTRQSTIVNDIASNIIERITQFEGRDGVMKDLFKKSEKELEKSLDAHSDHLSQLIFKTIDGNNETINSLLIENSKFLTNTLKKITEDDKKMK